MYTGQINENNTKRFLEAVNNKKLNKLIISSSGGEINLGMSMGEWVYDNTIDSIGKKHSAFWH